MCVCVSVLCVKAGSDHHAGSVRRRPQVVDGGHGWERTGRLPRLPVCSYSDSDKAREREKERHTQRERETEGDGEVRHVCCELRHPTSAALPQYLLIQSDGSRPGAQYASKALINLRGHKMIKGIGKEEKLFSNVFLVKCWVI